ncbi:hypothetical protein AAFC00_003515 [Neodothiora populina]|uniref:Uncharacterized protein n=1 Tax=Neodothiora populina TaxID=2781224 RepID=A0ABR3PEF9_9PEZI
MFGSYGIATASRHPSSLPCHEEDYPGPTLTCHSSLRETRTGPSQRPSISQLALRFSEHSLHHLATPIARSEPSQIDLVDDIFSCAPRQQRRYVGSSAPSGRRVSRQQGVRLLCDPSHLRSIQEMVEKMIRSEDQCSVSSSSTLASSEDVTCDTRHDEGYSSLEENTILSKQNPSSSTCKRSSSSPKTAANVSKSMRLRNNRPHRGLTRVA